MTTPNRALWHARRLFYVADGPWYRTQLFERLGSERYAYPALFAMDRMLTRHVLGNGPGTFFEAGAHDGYTQSNTYALEARHGWSGVLVEAVPKLAAKCAKRRQRSRVFNCALVEESEPGATVKVYFGDLLSNIADARGSEEASKEFATGGLVNTLQEGYEVEVPARTLDSVLQEAGVERPDVMCLDVEGLELGILRGSDLERHGPRWLLIEMLDMDAQLPAFQALLGDQYEIAEIPTPHDVLFRALR